MLTFIAYHDLMRNGMELIVRNEEATRAVSVFLPDPTLEDAHTLAGAKCEALNRLCALWYEKYAEHILYVRAEGLVVQFMLDNTIEGEVLAERKAIESGI